MMAESARFRAGNAASTLPNTLSLPCTATRIYRVASNDDIQDALVEARELGLRTLPLGEGSNVVLPPALKRAVLYVTDESVEVLKETSDSVVLRVGAGHSWHDLVNRTVSDGYFGLENLALIPGKVGAAPVQNIGAYGRELSEFVIAVHGVHLDSGAAACLSPAQCAFAYRYSVFKGSLRDRFLITAVTLRLSKIAHTESAYPALARRLEAHQWSATPEHVLNAVVELRRERLPDPAQKPNAGSFFKNPIVSSAQADELRHAHPAVPLYAQAQAGRVKVSAAWLIEACGLRGLREGAVAMSERHALVMINCDGAIQSDVLRLAALVQAAVRRDFAIELEIEPRVYDER